jgi:hypothetical protein
LHTLAADGDIGDLPIHGFNTYDQLARPTHGIALLAHNVFTVGQAMANEIGSQWAMGAACRWIFRHTKPRRKHSTVDIGFAIHRLLGEDKQLLAFEMPEF